MQDAPHDFADMSADSMSLCRNVGQELELAEAPRLQHMANLERHPAEVIISRPSGSKLGLVVSRDGGVAVVAAVRPRGVIAAWNELNPALAVRAGDTVVAVDGRRELPPFAEINPETTVTVLRKPSFTIFRADIERALPGYRLGFDCDGRVMIMQKGDPCFSFGLEVEEYCCPSALVYCSLVATMSAEIQVEDAGNPCFLGASGTAHAAKESARVQVVLNDLLRDAQRAM